MPVKYLKHIALSALLVLVSGASFATMDHFAYWTNAEAAMSKYLGSRPKFHILCHAIYRLNDLLKNDSIYLDIRVQFPVCNAYGLTYRHPYSLGLVHGMKQTAVGKRMCKTLYIRVQNPEFNLNDIINLAYFGIKRPESIRKKQNTLLFDSYDDTDPFPTIAEDEIEYILNTSFPEISRMAKARYHIPYDKNINCFYRDDMFYICDRKTCSPNLHEKTLFDADTTTPVSYYFSTDNIDQITTCDGNNYFIFTSDTSMYHINYMQGKVNGPIYFKLPLFSSTSDYVNGISEKNSLYKFTIHEPGGCCYPIGFDAVKQQFYFPPSGFKSRYFNCWLHEKLPYYKTEDHTIHLSINELKKRKQHIMLLSAIVLLSTVFLLFNKRL